MSIAYCFYCQKYIDTDTAMEHFIPDKTGCYDENKCSKYYEENKLLTELELERLVDSNERERILTIYFKYGTLPKYLEYSLIKLVKVGVI